MTSTDIAGHVRSGRPADPSRGILRPLGLGEVTITGGLLGRLQSRNHDVSLAHIEYWLEREGWLGNFDAAVQGRLPGARRGREFADTEIYKLLEALAWDYGRTQDPEINDRFERIAARVVAAQEPDGYLNTNFGRPGQAARYTDLERGHELYSFGHLIQAGSPAHGRKVRTTLSAPSAGPPTTSATRSDRTESSRSAATPRSSRPWSSCTG